MKKIFYLPLLIFVIISCSKNDEDNVNITVEIPKGLLGEWNVEWACGNRIHKYEFLEGGIFKYHFMDKVNNGTYNLSGRDLVISGYNDIGGGRNEYKIMVLTEDRLELDNIADWGIDYRFVRVCE